MRRSISRILAAACALSVIASITGCEQQYDASTPDAALNSIYQMIADGHPEKIRTFIHIAPRDITYGDGVTEASAINDVITKAGDMLGQLYRVAGKLRTRFAKEIENELDKAERATRRGGNEEFANFLVDPFGLMDEQRSRIGVTDLGDGTAAILLDGQPAFGFGLIMRELDGRWKVDVPIDLLQQYRPETREEWTVVANLMLAIEKAFIQFEKELDAGEIRDLNHASTRDGRLLGERALIQGLIYQRMKEER
jgi:hypothetical protein